MKSYPAVILRCYKNVIKKRTIIQLLIYTLESNIFHATVPKNQSKHSNVFHWYIINIIYYIILSWFLLLLKLSKFY